jgi:hypothetical protein
MPSEGSNRVGPKGLPVGDCAYVVVLEREQTQHAGDKRVCRCFVEFSFIHSFVCTERFFGPRSRHEPKVINHTQT